MKAYIGLRRSDGRAFVRVEDGEKTWLLPHPRYHSPTGFEWGYGGSGPADLALALLVDFFEESHKIPSHAFVAFHHDCMDAIANTRAFSLHVSFKWLITARLPRHVEAHVPYAEPAVAEVLPTVEEWRLTTEDIRKAVRSLLDLADRNPRQEGRDV